MKTEKVVDDILSQLEAEDYEFVAEHIDSLRKEVKMLREDVQALELELDAADGKLTRSKRRFEEDE